MGKALFVDPQTHAIVFFGAVMSGFVKDKACKIERTNRVFVQEEGLDGDITRSRISSKLTKVTVMLLQSSAANAILSAQLVSGENGINGSDVGSGSIRNIANGASILKTGQCWIEGWPDAEINQTASPREWVIMCASGDRFEQGA